MESRKKLAERTLTEQLVYAKVKTILEVKQNECVAPLSVSICDLTEEINRDIKGALNQFIKDKTMSWYKNVNGIMMFTIENELN